MNPIVQKRFVALDVFRGMTIAFMIIVNTPGSWAHTYSLLEHAQWHGFTPTDLVFPSFLFAVGNALAFVSLKWENAEFGPVFRKLFTRSLIIFAIGYVFYWIPFFEWSDGEMVAAPLSDTRIFGVLQRIALAYFFGGLLIYFLNIRQLVITCIVLLLGYWLIMYAFGDYSLEHNAERNLDLFLMAPSHLYHGEGIAFDPEGVLSTLPSIVNVLIGFMAGVYIRRTTVDFKKLFHLLAAGIVCMLIAYFWNLYFPVNKKIWTSSFVMLTCGLDLVLIGLLIYVLDVKEKKWNMNFFQVFGKNPLFCYLLSEAIVLFMLYVRPGGETLYGQIYQTVYFPIGPKIGSLLFALTVMMICWLTAYLLDRKNIIIKV